MASTIDYKQWEELARREEEEEKVRKERERDERRMKHFLEQAALKREWELKQAEEMKAKGIDSSHPNHHHAHHHHHGHAHDHAHDEVNASIKSEPSSIITVPNAQNIQAAPKQAAYSRPRCGCGYISPEDLKRLQEETPVPEVPLEEKNHKKRVAVMAAKEHGAQLFKEGQYQQALAVYERGVLIINGMFGISDQEMDEMGLIEATLDANMAACALKLQEYKKALDYAKMALSLDKSNKKALFRQAQALMFLDRYNEAKQVCVDAIREEPNNVDFRKLLDDIKRTDAEKTQKQKAFEMEMAQRMSERLASTAISS